jgi:GWxTD domain-containing protein
MKQSLTYIALFVYLFLATWQADAQRGIQADVRIFEYQTPDDEQFAEIYVAVLISSLKSDSSQLKKGVDMTLIVKKDGQISQADKYTLSGEERSAKDFYHILRLGIQPASYEFQIELVDLVDSTNRTIRSFSREIQVPSSQVTISSLQLLGNVTTAEEFDPNAKNGLLMEPLKFQYLNSNYDRLRAYCEIYKTDQLALGKYLLRYDIIHHGPLRADTVLTRYKRRPASAADPVMIQELNDTTWASGKYELVIHALDFDQNILAQTSADFVVSNPNFNNSEFAEEDDISKSFAGELTDEELNYSLRALAPKVNSQDVGRLNEMILNGSRESRMAFLYRFWEYSAPIDPKHGYLEYMNVVRAIDNMYFDGLGRGFETDRGYIYLKYGQPDHQISIEDEPTAPPYEIWTYTEFPATKQNNVKFVFYNPASTSYELLHSNARGEINDPQWLLKLYRNSPEDVIGNPIDARQVRNNWNRRAEEYFNE